ncbi:MAG: ATP-binding protein [Pseudonocardia sp.]|nr:ATP-binding protein [Pseudonocardia sp.]
MLTKLTAWLPKGNTLDDAAWARRHRLLEWVLLAHVPGLFLIGVALDRSVVVTLVSLAPILVLLAGGHLLAGRRRLASSLITAGLVYCSVALVGLTGGMIEAHFHFFIIIGFIALYQDWVPFLWNVLFTVVSHGFGTIFYSQLIFNHPAAQANPWLWSGIHGLAVLFACVGMVIFWRITEDEQSAKEEMGRDLVLADAEIGRQQFTSDMLVNLARRNQSMLYRQLDIINQLEEKEQDPDALAELFKLDHLATRVRRNAESLLVLSGEQPPRVWSAPVSLRDVVRAAIAETEDLDRVEFAVDDRLAVAGHSVADLTHLIAELTENAVRFSPPDTVVTIRSRPHRVESGAQVLTIEDWGVGMPEADLESANEMLLRPRDVDLSVSQRLGFHVVARLAVRHRIEVSLGATPGSGLTAVVVIPAALFVAEQQETPDVFGAGPLSAVPAQDRSAQHDTPALDRAPRTDRSAQPAGAYPGGGGLSSTGSSTGLDAPRRTTSSRSASDLADSGLPMRADSAVDAAFGTAFGVRGARPGEPGWTGWWEPPVDAETSGPGGRVANGHGTNGYGANGAGTNGFGTNGFGTNGFGGNGYGRTGYDGNGHEPKVPTVNGANGRAADGHGPNGTPSRPSPVQRQEADIPRPGTGQDADVPAPRSAPGAAPESEAGRTGLRRRVPQASLAPELRLPEQAPSPAAPAAPPAASASAAQALSRYQASRQAAQAATDHDQRPASRVAENGRTRT